MTKEELKQKRELLDKSQAQLADLLGVDKSTLSRWETGISRIPKAIDIAMKVILRDRAAA